MSAIVILLPNWTKLKILCCGGWIKRKDGGQPRFFSPLPVKGVSCRHPGP